MMKRSLRSGFGFVHGNAKQNCYGLRIFNFQPPQQCPVIVNQRQGVAQGGVDLHQGDVDLRQGGGVIKRAKSFSRPRSISPNPLRCFIPLLVIRRVKENLINIFLQTCVTGKTCSGSSSEPWAKGQDEQAKAWDSGLTVDFANIHLSAGGHQCFF